MEAFRYSKVLILNLGGLGDFITAMPVSAALKESGAESVTSLVWPALEEFARVVPAIDRVAVLPRDKENDPELTRFVLDLAGGDKFDLVLDFAFQPRAGIITRAAGGRRTLGFALDPRRYPWYTDILPNLPGQLRLDRNLNLPGHLGLPRPLRPDFSVRIPEAARLRVEKLLERHGLCLSCDRPVAVHPGSGVTKRNWPAERFARLADKIAESSCRPLVLLGGQRLTYDGRDETELARRVQGLMRTPAVNLAGVLDLAELTFLLQECSLFVGNNSGPAHLAATVAGTPALLIWAPRNEVRWRPWGAKVELVYAPVHCSENCLMNDCGRIEYCLNLITVEQAFDRFTRVFAGRDAEIMTSGGGR
ncbi:MAG: glycosyltransferase family 9 protein [Candidatus Glassbacteria bacterium]